MRPKAAIGSSCRRGLGEIRRFREKGVSVDALCEPELLARAEVAFFPDIMIFDFSLKSAGSVGSSAFIFLARDDQGEPCDLVAWAPQAKLLAAWYGNAALLGAESVYTHNSTPSGLCWSTRGPWNGCFTTAAVWSSSTRAEPRRCYVSRSRSLRIL